MPHVLQKISWFHHGLICGFSRTASSVISLIACAAPARLPPLQGIGIPLEMN